MKVNSLVLGSWMTNKEGKLDFSNKNNNVSLMKDVFGNLHLVHDNKDIEDEMKKTVEKNIVKIRQYRR